MAKRILPVSLVFVLVLTLVWATLIQPVFASGAETEIAEELPSVSSATGLSED